MKRAAISRDVLYKRIAAFAVDVAVCSFSLFFVYVVVLAFLVEFGCKLDVDRCVDLYAYLIYVTLLFKDIRKKGSVGKRKNHLQIISTENGKSITWVQRIMRNVGVLVLLVDIVVLLICGRRIGEIITHTTVIEESELDN